MTVSYMSKELLFFFYLMKISSLSFNFLALIRICGLEEVEEEGAEEEIKTIGRQVG